MPKPILKHFALIFLIFISATGRSAVSDSVMLAERAYYFQRYAELKDSMKTNTWTNLKRKSDYLEKIVKLDQELMLNMQQAIRNDSTRVQKYSTLRSKYYALKSIYNNDLQRSRVQSRQLQYLLMALLVMSFALLVGAILFLRQTGRMRELKEIRRKLEVEIDTKQLQIDNMDADLRRQKARESEFRDELEKGMITNHERMIVLQTRCSDMESENEKLRRLAAESGLDVLTMLQASIPPVVSDNPDELKLLLRDIYEERGSLINLSGRLRLQLQQSEQKYQALLNQLRRIADSESSDNS